MAAERSLKLRAFVAIELPAEVRSALGQVQRGLRSAGSTAVRWVNPEGVHLTLKFLGDVDQAQVGDIVRVVQEACAPVPPFSLGLSTPGAFPSAGSPRVLWIGLRGNLDSLAHLQRRVEASLDDIGFPREERAFSPHLALGRVREGVPPGQRRELGQALASCMVPETAPFLVDGVALMRSQLTPQGAIYTRLHKVPLAAIGSSG